MKQPSIVLLSMILFSSLSAQEKVDYDFDFVKLKYPRLQEYREGLSFKLRVPEKTNRLKDEHITALEPSYRVDMKYKYKDPDVIFYLDVKGITVKEMKTVQERNTFYKEIFYTVSNKIDVLKGSDKSLIKSIEVGDGTVVQSVKMGSNFFNQISTADRKYPKPGDIPSIGAETGYVPSFEETFGKVKMTPFTSREVMDSFVKRYTPFIEAKTEALAIEAEFQKDGDILMSLFGTTTYRDYLGLAVVAKKGRVRNFDDFDKANVDFAPCLKLLAANTADSAAYTTLRNLLAFYKGIETSNDPRMEINAVKTVVYYNISMLSTLSGDIDTAFQYYLLYDGMREKNPVYADYLRNIFKIKKVKAPGAGYPAAILAGL